MKPIIFSTEMVQAILAGLKTQTSRVVKGVSTELDCFGRCTDGDSPFIGFGRGERLEKKVKAPYQPGDILWVRETWGVGTRPDPNYGWVDGIEFKADEAFLEENDELHLYHVGSEDLYDVFANSDGSGWRPSIHMPKAAARLFLRVTDVRVERLQEILCNDMEKEGVIPPSVKGGQWQLWQADYFRPLWNKLNLKRGYGWETNPWVYVIEFERISKDEINN